jgi:hypothetical protein
MDSPFGFAFALVLASAPFQPAKMAEMTDNLKCDWGPVTSVSRNGAEFVVTTPAGPVTYKAGPSVQVISKDGKTVGPVSSLKPGQSVRVYYVIDNGAKVIEVDLQ